MEALKATANPTDKAALAKTLSTLKAATSVGVIDFNKSPMPNVIATSPILGMQWRKAEAGSKFKLRQVVTENAGDRNVPVTEKLVPYGG
jgi:branched-chain amino acid transport system substrate-binding protein